jgi:hypothetical protein
MTCQTTFRPSSSATAAPFTTCKNSAAVRRDAALLADWMSSNPNFDSALVTAASIQLWDVCNVLVDMHQYGQSKYELSFALNSAVEAGQLGLAHKLLHHGAWARAL